MFNKKNIIWPIIVSLFISTACLAQPPTETLSVSGLKETVIVRRDERSIPYIEAKNDEDLYFAQGYITASDRLWQMDLYRRVASGQTAEIFGKTALDQDKRWRKFGFEEVVKKSFEGFSPEYRTVLENYARGVNAYMATLEKDSLPVEFRVLQYRPKPWQPTDSLIIGKILADGLSTSWYRDATREKFKDLPKKRFDQLFIEKTPFDVLLVGKDFEKGKSKKVKGKREGVNLDDAFLAFADSDRKIRKESLEQTGFYQEFNAASNNWVISGKRTSSGKPILANDPHLQSSAPSIWYLSHLATPDSRVSGVTFPGVPGIVLGHNEHIAWGATNLGPDVQDLYIEDFNEKNQYKTSNGLKKAKIRIEEIKVRTNPLKTDVEIEKILVFETENGVIIQEQENKKIALNWTALDSKNNEFEAFYLLNRAKNWDEFKSALKTYGGATQNFIYADVKGNIGFHNGGSIPIRKSGDGSFPYDGSKSEGDWIGYIPFEELPNSYNPPEGFIVTANQRLAGDNYKYNLGQSWASPYRARRIYQLLQGNPKMTVRDSMDIQNDVFNISYSNFAREIVKMEAAGDETLRVLRAWDGKMLSDSKGAVLVDEIRREFTSEILNGILGREKAKQYRWSNSTSFTDWLLREKPLDWLSEKYSSYKDLLLSADKTARENLEKKFGSDKANWTWGNRSQMNFPHPLDGVPVVGSAFKINPLPKKGSGQTPNVGVAVSMRHITVPGDWDKTRQGIALGQSGDPRSPFWKDQLDSWSSGDTPVFPFTDSAVKGATKRLILMKSN